MIVNGGLGPTVDDLSQEVAAEACGVPLVLHDHWMTRMTESFYARRGRVMPPNNRKQAMLPEDAEFIDNPIGTACGFAVTIGKARFFFTPGVPREMRRMLDEQVIPRLLKQGGITGVTRLKRFHSFGIGESARRQHAGRHGGLHERPASSSASRRTIPQLETKLAVRGDDEADLDRMPGAGRGGGAQAAGQLHHRRGRRRRWKAWSSPRCATAAYAGDGRDVQRRHIAARLAPLPAPRALFRQGS